MTVSTRLYLADRDRWKHARGSYLFVGIFLGWFAAVAAHMVAHRFADACIDIVLPASSAPAIERPVLPGT